MGIPGSQEVVAAGSSAPSRVRARPAGRVASPGPEACGARAGGRAGGGSPRPASSARVSPAARPRSRLRLPSAPGPPRPRRPAPDGSGRVQDGDSADRAPGRVGAPLLAARARSRGPTKNSRDPSIFGSPDPEAAARVPSRPAPPRLAPPRPAPRRAEWRRAGVTEGNLLRYLPRAPPPGPGQPPNLVTSPASITRLACVSAARLQVLLPQPPAFEWRQCRSALLPSGRGWERTRRPGARFPGLGQLLERPLLVLGTLAC